MLFFITLLVIVGVSTSASVTTPSHVIQMAAPAAGGSNPPSESSGGGRIVVTRHRAFAHTSASSVSSMQATSATVNPVKLDTKSASTTSGPHVAITVAQHATESTLVATQQPQQPISQAIATSAASVTQPTVMGSYGTTQGIVPAMVGSTESSKIMLEETTSNAGSKMAPVVTGNPAAVLATTSTWLSTPTVQGETINS